MYLRKVWREKKGGKNVIIIQSQKLNFLKVEIIISNILLIYKEKLVTIGKPNCNSCFLLKTPNPDRYCNPRDMEDIAAVFKVTKKLSNNTLYSIPI